MIQEGAKKIVEHLEVEGCLTFPSVNREGGVVIKKGATVVEVECEFSFSLPTPKFHTK